MKFTNENRTIVYGSRVVADDNPSEFYQAMAEKTSQEHGFAVEDLKPVKYWLCSVGQNRNKDYWGEEEMKYAAPTIALKPININHNRKDDGTPTALIGVNYEGMVETNPETGKLSVLAKAVLFTYLYDGLEVFRDICSDIDNGKAYASMECVFDEYYAVHPQTGEIVESVQTEKDFAKELRAGNIARKFGNPLLIGSAFLKGKPPADPNAMIYPDDLQVYTVNDGMISYLQPNSKKNIKTEEATLRDIIEMHALSHTAYNRIKRYGVYKGWSVKEAMRVHADTSKSLSDIGIDHNTQLSGDKPSMITMPMLKGWFEDVDVVVGGELAKKPATYGYIPLTSNDSRLEPVPVSKYAPVEFIEKLRVITRDRQSSNYREVNRDDSSTKQYIQDLTKNINYWKKVSSLLYNKSTMAVAHLALAIKLHPAVNCVVRFGSISTLDLEDTCWIESLDKVVRLTTDGLWFADLEGSEHDFSNVVETVDADYKVASTFVAERFGVDIANTFQELVQYGSDCPLPKIESMFSIANGQTPIEYNLYLRKKTDSPSMLMWNIGDSWGCSLDIEDTLIGLSKSLPLDTVVEGYLSDEIFNIYDVLMYGEYVADKPYKDRYELLQKLANDYIKPVDTVITTANNLIESVCKIEAGYGAIARLENSTYYGEGYFDLRPIWVFSAKVLDKVGSQYKIGNSIAHGLAEYKGNLNIDEEVEVSCDWIVPDGKGRYILCDLEVI